jgi:TonB family protein
MTTDRFGNDDLSALEDDYEILSEIGRGGVSTVYLARELELDREVAIKVVRQGYVEDDESRVRVEREARMLAQLQHPNIVTLLTSRRLGDGRRALVMQVARGRTIRAMLEQDGPVAPDLALGVLSQVASALDYLHGRGIVHRDVKPENIFLDPEGRVLLSDLGIAKSNEAPVNVTLTGVIVGTPTYMSPEQIDGSPLDGRSDQYSVGLVVHELLSGVRPWDGENLYSVIFKQKSEHLPSIATLRSDVPEALDAAVRRALAKDPSERYPDMATFAREAAAVGVFARAAVPPPVVAPGDGEAAPEQEPDEATVPAVVAAGAPSVALVRHGDHEEEPTGTLVLRPERLPSRRGRAVAVAAAVVLVSGGLGIAAATAGTGTLGGWIAGIGSAPQLSQPSSSAAEVAAPAIAALGPGAEPIANADGPPLGETPDALAIRDEPAEISQPATAAPAAPRPPADAEAARLRAERVQTAARESAALATFAAADRLPATLAGASVAAPRTPAPVAPVAAPATVAVAPELQNMGAIRSFLASQMSPTLRDSGRGGTVTLGLALDARGRVVNSEVVASSGNSELDALVRRAAARMRFTPAQRNGLPVDTRIELPLVVQP